MTEDTSRWIEIPNWEVFQHYKDRRPSWIKLYVELLDHDEYRRLNLRQRGLLHDLWLLTARRGNGRLPCDHPTLTSALALDDHGDKTWLTRDLETLNHAGFVEFRASRALAPRYQRASTEVLLRKTKEGRRTTSVAPPSQNGKKSHRTEAGELRDSEGFLY